MSMAAIFCFALSGIAILLGQELWGMVLFIVANLHLAIGSIQIAIYPIEEIEEEWEE